MGLYQDIQNDIGEALRGDLNDAYKSFNITAFGVATYDPVTGVKTSNDNTQPCQGVLVKNSDGDLLDDPSNIEGLVFLVMDEDKPFDLKIGHKITFNNKDYKVEGVDTDPVFASWNLSCIKWK